MLSEVEYFLDPCTSMQKLHLSIISIVVLLHLLQKSPNLHLASPIGVRHEYPNLEGEFGLLLIDSTLLFSCPTF